MVVPTAILTIASLATFVALIAYATDLVIDGVPLVEPTLGARVYPIDALPSRYTDWLPALILSIVASLARTLQRGLRDGRSHPRRSEQG
jgi:hypothetical protein